MNQQDSIKQRNRAFYTALEDMDLEAMSRIWVQSAEAVCIHPGWETLRGWPEIRESWRAIFAATGYMRFEPSDVTIHLHGDAAHVSCVENIFTVVDGMTIHSRIACTNIFTLSDGEWRMVLHHGSGIASAQSVQFPDSEVSN